MISMDKDTDFKYGVSHMRRGKRADGEEMDICTSASGIFMCVCVLKN
jgi:hypothetical protein